MCLELAKRGLERAITHKFLQNEIAQEFPQHWLGSRFYYDLPEKYAEYAPLYFVPRDGDAGRFLLTDREEVLERLVPDRALQRDIISLSRPAFVFRSETDLTFECEFRQPDSFATFLDWLESVLPDTRNRAIKRLASRFPSHLVSLFVNAPNGCVGVMVDASQLMLKAAQRQEGLRRIINSNASNIGIRRYSGTRIDLPFIFQRNMNKHSPLTARRIALIGCGTIGSHLAKFLRVRLETHCSLANRRTSSIAEAA